MTRPEVDEFRHTLYDHLGITDYDERDFIHELAHVLYNKAFIKGKESSTPKSKSDKTDPQQSMFEAQPKSRAYDL